MLKISHIGPITRFDLSRTLAGRGRYWTTAYLLDGLLIDSGAAHTRFELQGALAGTPLQGIINTHSHEDHIGANALLQASNPGLAIHAHPLALPVLAQPRQRQPLQPYRRLFWGWPDACQAEPVLEGELIQTPSYTLQVLYTPGHSPDHLCLYEAQQGWLFSGDLFVGGYDRALRFGYDIWGIIASLKRIAALPLELLLPGSARVRQKPLADLEQKIAYLEGLGDRILRLHQLGHSTAQIAREALGGPMWVEMVTLGHFSRRWLVWSFLRQRVSEIASTSGD